MTALRELRAVVDACLDCCAAEATIESIHARIAKRIRREFGLSL